MAAGLGFKDFQTGEVLTAADVDGYLMQGVWVFASAAARDAAVTSPQEGNFAYLKDTNVTTYYTGSAWANLDTTGMTNPMTTTGDTIYSSSGSTPARLGIGSTGDVLTVAGGVPSWAAPASGGGLTLLSTTTLSGASTTITIAPTGYVNLLIVGEKLEFSGNDYGVIYLNSSSNVNYIQNEFAGGTGATAGYNNNTFADIYFYRNTAATGQNDNSFAMNIYNVNASAYKNWNIIGTYKQNSTSTVSVQLTAGVLKSTSAVTNFVIQPSGGNWNAGTVKVYGVK